MHHTKAICVNGFKQISIHDYEILSISDDSIVASDQTADVIYLDEYQNDNQQSD